jgi:hypothetical protein
MTLPVQFDKAFLPESLPSSPVLHEKSQIVLIPTCRFDGEGAADSSWNMPEQNAWNWLRTVEIEHIQESVGSGSGGSFLAKCRNLNGDLRDVILRFDTVGFTKKYEVYGREYGLNPNNHDILRREQASYEVAKLFGCEDIFPPIAARETNLVPLISDAVRDKIASDMNIDQLVVDETFGIISALQMVPFKFESFVSHLISANYLPVGAGAGKFGDLSDALRHGIYRMIALDFVLGVGDRSLIDLMINKASGSVVAYGFGISMPDPVSSANIYFENRSKGWGRKIDALSNADMSSPPIGNDLFSFSKSFEDNEKLECIATFKQISKAIDESSVILLCKVIYELGIPLINIAGLIGRLSMLQDDPESVLLDSFEFNRSILAPMRRGYAFDAGRNMKIVETVNQVMTVFTGEAFDFSTMMTA